jgi:hypothetical protein
MKFAGGNIEKRNKIPGREIKKEIRNEVRRKILNE